MSEIVRKRRKLGPDQELEEITAAEYEEDLNSILLRIQQQEDSEALARQLEAEWNGSSSTSASAFMRVKQGKRNEIDVIVIPENDDEEDDEAMARRLSREWDEQDRRSQPSQPVSSSSQLDSPVPVETRRPINSLSAPTLDVPPNEKLREYQSLFTQERSCPRCSKNVQSPRGQVCHLSIHQPYSTR
jgi:baculoviral IAP repeat-containing protein 6